MTLSSTLVLIAALLLQAAAPPLPESATTAVRASLLASQRHARSVWRDTSPYADGGQLRGVIEIARGDRRKFEFDIGANRIRLDRTMPASVGGYPVNYGFVPQTISYDGDPFDILVLGPALASGTRVQGVIVGLLHMEDEKGLDSKVVISKVGRTGQPQFSLTDSERQRIAVFFDNYKRHEPGKFSRVTGWGSVEDGLAFVRTTHAAFCAAKGGC